jgi:hypothetical protein
LNPPFKPEINDKYDINNFDEEFITEDVNESFISDRKSEIIKKNNDKFKEFTQ